MVKVSVILTAFNEEKYIGKAIDSILNQTLTDFELIIVNDGSTDNTLNIINSFEDKRIKLISHDNIGPGASRNKALNIAKGEYIMYLDGDDWYHGDGLEIAYKEAKNKDTDFTFYQMINYDEKTGKTYENDWFNLNIFDESFENTVFNINDFKGSIFDLSVGVCQKIYNTSFLKRIDAKFPEGILFEDMPFFYYVLLKAEKISIIKKQLYYRRKHDESITHVVDEKFLDTVPAGQELIRIFMENGWYDTYKFDLLAYKINGPRFALRDIEENYKIPLYRLIKKDYHSIKQSEYYQDYLENLGQVKKKFFLDIIKSKNYDDYLAISSNKDNS
ncbi:Glycosyltransferase involved in cell wall bisynthesis [Methanobrevibacter gottschalkii]|uniref:Glycosyltransferase involved in cell wall bisynthesis n=1 Tax=Methanobrevibacter gottschalkii TaxID=190974 RepID=A0A1H7NFN1_9EURY|nr:glycosyltransferase family 2 protein [Methanobrevibacter gottschalkii]SEL21805.1 Glycosyltransferase involved in cell wall bisynthesis [Methanobrevibacter gottschalkii]